jgi:hypothetical protein
MKVTTEMLQAATRKAIEAGLLPRHPDSNELAVNQELLRMVLQAALSAASVEIQRPLRMRLTTDAQRLDAKWLAGWPTYGQPATYRNLAK